MGNRSPFDALVDRVALVTLITLISNHQSTSLKALTGRETLAAKHSPLACKSPGFGRGFFVVHVKSSLRQRTEGGFELKRIVVLILVVTAVLAGCS